MRGHALFFFPILLAACTQGPVPQASPLRELVLKASAGEMPAKTSRDAAGTFYWTPGDEIHIFRGEAEGRLKSTNTVPAPAAEFKGSVPAELLDAAGEGLFWGLYPYNESNRFDAASQTLTTTVAPDQIAAEGTFADGQFVSVGCSDTLSMTFHHLCSGIRFSLSYPGITRITLRGRHDEVLAGKVEVALDEDGQPVVREVLEGATAVTLSCPEGFRPGVDYFFVTLPVSLPDGFVLDFGDGLTRSVTTELSLNRARFQWSLSTLDSVFDIPYETFDIVNTKARNYLTNVDYSGDPDYTQSQVPTSWSRWDSPVPVSLSWTGGNATGIRMSLSPFFEPSFSVDGTSSPVKVPHLIPGRKYYYKVMGSGDSVLKLACVTPIGPLRMVDGVSSAGNVRDLGGWEADEGHLAYGKLFRGGNLDDIQSRPAAKDILFNILGVSVDLDLRGMPPGSAGGSGEKNPWLESDPIEYVNLQPWNYFVASTNQYYKPTEAEMGASAEIYQSALRSIIGWLGEGKVVYIHCHGGSDRTGTLAFLIEALLGVSESDLSKDYEITCATVSNIRRRNGNGGWFFAPMVRYLRTFAPEGNIKDQVTAWAMTRHAESVEPLTGEEIALLRQYMIER
jgi:hypothetical protein